MILSAAAATSARVLYHVGDFGLWGLSPLIRGGVYGDRSRPSEGFAYLDGVNTALSRVERELWVVLGNHENYDEWERMPVGEDGTRRHPRFPNVVFLPRSFVWRDPMSGRMFGSVGGAGSVDKVFREEGESWWPQEEITRDDIELFKGLPGSGGVEVFLTHDAPAGSGTVDDTRPPDYATPDILQYCNRQRVLLRDALDWARPKVAFHGHWHRYAESVVDGVGYDGQGYSTRIVGLGMDDMLGNGVVYRGDTNTVTTIPVVP
jgi:hypothetical protein